MNTTNEEIQRIADAAKKLSKADLTDTRIEAGTDAFTVAWQFTREPFGLRHIQPLHRRAYVQRQV